MIDIIIYHLMPAAEKCFIQSDIGRTIVFCFWICEKHP